MPQRRDGYRGGFGGAWLVRGYLVGTALVFLAAIAWTVTILTMLIAVVKARRRPPAEVSGAVHAGAQTTDADGA